MGIAILEICFFILDFLTWILGLMVCEAKSNTSYTSRLPNSLTL
jgi:hypothetical protein